MLLTITLALAQHVDLDTPDVLTAADLPWEASSVGHPALWFDDDGFRMVFESRIEVEGCDQAYQLGMATSIDGHDWDVSARTVAPSEAAPCGFRAPVAADTSDGLLVLARAVHDDTVWARRHNGRRTTSWQTTGLDDLTGVSVARRDGQWFGVGVDPDMGLVTLHSSDAHTWTRNSYAVLPYGSTWWSLDDIVSPSVSCFDGTSMPWVMHYGGWTGDDAGFTYGISDDMQVWFLSLAAQIRSPDDAWVAWDAVATPSSAWIAFEANDSDAISWAWTQEEIPVDPASRDCTSSP